LAIVPRVSTEDQEEYGTSLDDQKAKGLLLGQLHDYTVDDRPYQEGGHIYSGDESGALPLAHRPIMRRLIADAQAHEFDAVCFTKIDRIARRLKYILEIWDALDEAGVTVLVIDPAIDTSTPIGRLIRNVLGSIAEFERDTIVERTQGGRRRTIMAGGLYLPHGKYGYTYTPMDRTAGTPGHIDVNKENAEVIERIFRRRAQRAGYERIATELTADGIPSPAGKGHWRDATIKRIVTDPAYKGEGEWGKRRACRSAHGKRTSQPNPGGRARIKVHYPAIVDEALWRAANDVETCGERHPVRAPRGTYLLYGQMVRCAEHGRTMTGATSGKATRTYRCCRHLPTGKRTNHQVPGRALEEAVWREVTEFLLEPARGLEAARQLAVEAERSLEHLAARRLSIAARLSKIDAEILYTLREARAAGLPASVLEASANELADEQRRLHAEDVRLEAQMALAREQIPAAEQVEAICRAFAQGATDADWETKRQLLEMLEIQVQMRGLNYHITGRVRELERRGTLGVYRFCTSWMSVSLTPYRR
jgi:site-specific DNA recombinase